MFETFIGLEIHVQLKTESKIFCNCRAAYGDEPNTNVCPVCMGYPGVLPALNEKAMELSYLVAMALNCEPSAVCAFDRKNYFYPDLPKNYQISQFAKPLGLNGRIDFMYQGEVRSARIKECHLEEDAGKMIHAGDMSLLDFNRTGTPLLEIVTEPDLKEGEEAEALLHELRRMVRYLGVCDGNMDEGSMRCDANISVNHQGQGLGSKVEVKNLNSSKFVRKALNYEINRQQGMMSEGKAIAVETRLWNENRDITELMRSKEEANDYRYFPEPDLPPFNADGAFLERVKTNMIELPMLRRNRIMQDYGLSDVHADIITEEKSGADFFEQAVKEGADAQSVAAWYVSDIKKHLNKAGIEINESPMEPQWLADMLARIERKEISGKIAKDVLDRVFAGEGSPAQIIEAAGLQQITDPAQLAEAVDAVFASHPKALAEIQAGDKKPVGFVIGQVMRATGGKADPGLLATIIAQKTST
ncbi:MAG: Asp-tRNA(Asn)/Glu-tRNA(Gln) amidotransferase subunit GatB [Spirochaetaceae bacterium]|nr:MAG: Asp-tRNA(Asn)/Glu-tRNA(Gln) amidotransferase subunit GatB [Spirochaetaceae bacterium]